MENQPEQSQPTQPALNVTQPADTTKSRRGLLILAWLLVVILATGLVGTYLWQHNKVNSLSNQLASSKTSVPKASTKSSQSTAVSNPTPTIATDTLPGGTKVSYPLTASNANVVWWSDGNDSPSSLNTPPNGLMRVTDKRVIQFLSTIPTDVIQKLCTSEWDNETGFNMGVYDTTQKTLTLHNQYQNCIDAVAADTGGKYTVQAQQVLTDSTNDLNAWAKSLTISK